MFRQAVPRNRRQFLKHCSAGALTLAAATRFPGLLAQESAPEWVSLGALGKPRGISFGFALNPLLIETNAAYAGLVARECTIAVPENVLKWAHVHPQPETYSFGRPDLLLAFTQKHGIRFRGHNFCWHLDLPGWLTRTATKDSSESILRDHISTVAGRYKGRMHSWDVVNEGVQLRDGLPDGLRNSFWYRMLGPRYFDIAYDAAHRADPAALLTYNDFGLEYDNLADPAKRMAVLALLSSMIKRGVPIHALGMQSHLRAGSGEKFGPGLQTFLKQVRDLGLQVFITEMDMDDHRLKLEGPAREQAVVDIYKRYLDIMLDSGDVPVVITWGVWDTPHFTGAEAAGGPVSEHPLLFREDGSPKAEAFAVAECIRQALPQLTPK